MMNKVVMTSRSAPFVADSIARLYGSHYFRWNKLQNLTKMNKIHKNNALFIVGLYCKDRDMLSHYTRLVKHYKKTVIIFSGTDVLQLKKSPEKTKLLRMLNSNNVVFASVGDTLKEEVKTLFNIDSKVLYLPSPHSFPQKPPAFSENFSVGCYIPSTNPKFYGFDLVRKVARLDSSIFYHIYSLKGGGRKEFKVPRFGEENLIFHNEPISSKEMPAFIKKMKCGLRITEHDGYPMSIVEYVMMGRYFIFNNDMPHCDILRNPSPKDVMKALNDIRGREELNLTGAQLYKGRHGQDVFKRSLLKMYGT